MNKFSYLYLNLIKNPFIPKIYRELCDYYSHMGMVNEAEAFRNLLKEKYNELYSPDIDNKRE